MSEFTTRIKIIIVIAYITGLASFGYILYLQNGEFGTKEYIILAITSVIGLVSIYLGVKLANKIKL
jgi:hypothetical protein